MNISKSGDIHLILLYQIGTVQIKTLQKEADKLASL